MEAGRASRMKDAHQASAQPALGPWKVTQLDGYVWVHDERGIDAFATA